MTEISFARSFLSALDSRPIKLDSSHATDPRTLPSQSIYTLPPPTTSSGTSGTKRKRPSPAAPSTASPSDDSLTLTLRDLKSTDPSQSALTLPSLPRTSSVYDAKAAWASHAGVGAKGVKLLFGKRPVADSKTLGDVFGAEAREGELLVMLMPGARTMTDPVAGDSKEGEKADADGEGKPVPLSDAFWADLDEFLVGKVGAAEGARLGGVFRKAAAS